MPELARHVQTHLGLPPADVVNEVEDKKDHVLGLEFRYWGLGAYNVGFYSQKMGFECHIMGFVDQHLGFEIQILRFVT